MHFDYETRTLVCSRLDSIVVCWFGGRMLGAGRSSEGTISLTVMSFQRTLSILCQHVLYLHCLALNHSAVL